MAPDNAPDSTPTSFFPLTTEARRHIKSPVSKRVDVASGRSSGASAIAAAQDLKWRSVSGRQLTFINETLEIEASYGKSSPEPDIHFDEPLTPNNGFLDDQETVFGRPTSHSTSQDIAADALLGLALGSHHRLAEIDGILPSTPFHQQSHSVPSLTDGHFPLSGEIYHLSQSILAQDPLGSYGDDAHIGATITSPVCCFGLCGTTAVDCRVFPLKNRHEAELLRCYSEHIAPFLDFFDQKQTCFATTVLEAAASQPLLMQMIFRVTERYIESFQRHQSLSSNTQAWSECQKCLQSPITARYQELDEGALVTLVLRRFLVGIESTTDSNGYEGSWTGMCDVLNAQAEFLLTKGLYEAAFWAGVRQEIYIAVLHQQATSLCLDTCGVDRSMEDAEDEIWVCRITLHLLDVLGFCFGPGAHNTSSTSAYNRLVDYSAMWAASVPDSFDPLFSRLPESHESFPEIMFLNDCAMAAWQYYHLTRLLLTAYNPNTPRIGTNYLAALKSTDNDIKSDVNILCGIAETVGYERKGCMAAIAAIALAGDRFTDREEQQSLLAFLARLERDIVWPTRSLQKELKQSWGQAIE
ncbi:hypothetical protein O1611_g187 [Lasiodiplodia mahajangana]|uniref:Uncharacterized protein n=1 Tax=Lasiodiplodia mahajangana TaxID=1108764 RepID=A0ACC2K187_9PEZI|nr:hypothetical protein O1611_g187 [Lasiodiplodia mahajangana]